MLNRIAELKRKGKSSKEALRIALEEYRAKRLEDEKKAHKAEKKRKAKEDKERKKQRGTKPPSNLADDAASAD